MKNNIINKIFISIGITALTFSFSGFIPVFSSQITVQAASPLYGLRESYYSQGKDWRYYKIAVADIQNRFMYFYEANGYDMYCPGYRISCDGYYGPATTRAIKFFQSKFNLVQDGVVGYNTWEYLKCESAFGESKLNPKKPI